MCNDKKPESKVARTAMEETAATGGGAVAGAAVGALIGGPAGGAVGAAVGAFVDITTKTLFTIAEVRASEQVEKRKRAFQQEFDKALATASPEQLASLSTSEDFSEILFQSFRRAIDALDKSVLPAIARLTWLYHDRAADGYFRSWGRVLEELSAEEYLALREIVSAIVQINASCECTPWTGDGRDEMRLRRVFEPRLASIFSARPGSRRALALLAAQDFIYNPFYGQGADLASVGSYKLELETCKKAQRFIEPMTVILNPPT